MITVEETWHLSQAAAGNVPEVMQAIEDVMGPIAHAHPGWCGHAHFLQQLDDPARVMIIYPWRSIEDHEDLIAQEDPRLAHFYETHCAQPRSFRYYTELPHD